MKYLSFDIRALSLMRICVAFVILLDLTIRITDLEAFYSNTGVAPLPMIFDHAWNDYYISFHAISGKWEVQLVLFMLAYFCATMLLIGYRTRLFTILSWVLLLSLHNRNVLILQGGDDLLRMTLFWAMFMPWGARYSCDRLLDPNPSTQTQIRSFATFAYLLQICYVYTGSALLKGTEWHTDCTALYYVYSLDQISYPITRYFYNYPDLLRTLTRVAYYFELLIPLFFFAPFKHSLIRFVGVLVVFGFHLFNGLTIYIGLFFMIGMVTAIGLLPGFAMDNFDRITRRLKRHVIDSLLSISIGLQRFIPWKRPRHTFHPYIGAAWNSLLIFLIVYVLYWNLSNLNSWNYKMGNSLKCIAYTLRIDQHWGMFAPGVFKDDGWYIFEAITEKGDTLTIPGPMNVPNRDKPKNLTPFFKSDRWRKYSENLLLASNSYMRGYLCNYTKRIYNEKHPDEKIKTLRIIYMMEFSEPDYCIQPAKETVLFECWD